MNLLKIMPAAAIVMLALFAFLFFQHTIGTISPLFGAIVALAAVSFFGWFIIDSAH